MGMIFSGKLRVQTLDYRGDGCAGAEDALFARLWLG